MKKSRYTQIIAFFITIILVVILFTQISLTEIITTLISINPVFLLAGFILYICSYILRAWRFHILLNKEVSIKDLFHIECIHNMMNSILPARTGELSYVFLLKKMINRTTGDGLATLIVARIFDFIALAILFFIAVLLVNDIPAIIKNILWLIVLLTIALLIFLIVLLYTGRKFIIYLQKNAERFHVEKIHIINYLLQKGFETSDSLDKIEIKKQVSFLLINSLFIWVLNYLMVYIIIAGMNFQVPFLIIILGGTFILLTTILPIQGIVGFGTTETIWTLVFIPLGFSTDQAIISGFCYHIVIILYFIILGIYGWIVIRMYY